MPVKIIFFPKKKSLIFRKYTLIQCQLPSRTGTKQNRETTIRNSPIQGGDDDAGPERQVPPAEDLDGDGASDDLLDVGPDHGDLGHEPERAARPVGVLVPAELGEVPARGDPEARGEELHEEAHGGGPHEQPQQRVPGDGARLEVPLEVARGPGTRCSSGTRAP